MTFTKIMKDIFTRTPKSAKDNSANGGAKRFLSKISGAFMLPISVMAIGGLFLGVGAAIASHTDATVFGSFIQNLGDPIFGAMPALFMVAIVISFTEDIGTAVFAGLVAFLVFNAIQIPFITLSGSHAESTGIVQATASGQTLSNVKMTGNNSAKILFGMNSGLEERLYKLVGTNLGLKSLNTSVFGGIIVGMVVAWAYNRFHETELPSMMAFFGGKRFVPLVSIILMIPLAFSFLLIWPWIGIGLSYFGEYSGKVKGLDSFVFGFAERALVPFGLHHVFYAPLWWTQAGGEFDNTFADWSATHQLIGDAANAKTGLVSAMAGSAGDQTMWINAYKMPFDSIDWADGKTGAGAHHSQSVYKFLNDELGLNLGRFMQGKYGFMQFALPAAGAAMIMSAPKENRKLAAGVIVPASLTSFVTGVTEPIEFTFVFLAPALFWGFHALMAGISFLLMNLLGAHMGMTFSGGAIDTVIYGMIPMAKGTGWWWAYVIEIVYAPIYYFVFLWAIKHFDLSTPGRGGNTKLFTKKDFKAAKAGEVEPQILAIIDAYGGKNNIVKTANCATRLRYDVKDVTKVSEDKLKAAGALGVMFTSKTHVQAIMGTTAEVLNGKVNKALPHVESAGTVKQTKSQAASDKKLTA